MVIASACSAAPTRRETRKLKALSLTPNRVPPLGGASLHGDASSEIGASLVRFHLDLSHFRVQSKW